MKNKIKGLLRIAREGVIGGVIGTGGDVAIENDDPVLACILAIAAALYRLAVEMGWMGSIKAMMKG